MATYIVVGKVPGPQAEIAGRTTTQIWTEAEIEHVRQLLPKIANGRKTRYKKKQSALSNQQSVKTKEKAQPRAAVPHKQRKPAKKKPKAKS
ncbi:MAG: hypothetical protein LAO78_24345 [Acidobacteriia bacterium]|nr:hypothetical protein [Terriglobia bacterium]